MVWSLELDPTTNSRIDIKLYRNVKNVEEIRKRLFKGELNCCCIKPTLILDPFQIAVAANKALISDNLTTKTIFTEILFNLSISKNITSSLQTFGVQEGDTDILIATISKVDEPMANFEFIDGIEVEIDVLKEITDFELLKKTYKISEVEFKSNDMLDSLVTRIAVK